VYAIIVRTTPVPDQNVCMVATLLSQLRHIESCLSGDWASR